MNHLNLDYLENNQNIINLENLTNIFAEHIQEGIAIAFSGGVDSSLLLQIACNVGQKANRPVLAVTFETKLHPHGDLEEAREIAINLGALHKTIVVDEFTDSEIMNNPVDRCYRCKKLLFKSLIDYATNKGYTYLIDGSNYDDLSSYRPGMRALAELGIHSPLLELQITKKQIRSLAAKLGVASSDKPSAPCLATRLPYGTRFDYDLLNRIDQGEQFIKSLGFYNVRLRLHQDIIRIEVDQESFSHFLDYKDCIINRLKELGFVYITLDMEGFRSGSMDIKISR
ncbi:MAG: ATP-dependent sacrificial sulfur transferase LarE [Herbinix sp.]|nr:ATP-dependent sacrificial sulfur transferase LarE [Herbinix sp.]